MSSRQQVELQQQPQSAGQIAPAPGALNPGPPPVAPAAAASLYQRIGLLRERAVRLGNQGRSLTVTAAVITLITSGLGGLMALFTVPIFMFSSGSPAVFTSSTDLFLVISALVGLALTAAAAFYSIHVLVSINNLYHRTYGEVRYKLFTGGLGLLLADESIWQRIHDGLNQATVLKMVGKSTYKKFEDHLVFCACHIESLEAVDRGREVSVWKLRHEEMAFRNQRMFQQQTWVYWVGGCVTFLFGRVLFFLALLFTVWGSRYVSSQAALVAICEFLLVDDLPPQPVQPAFTAPPPTSR